MVSNWCAPFFRISYTAVCFSVSVAHYCKSLEDKVEYLPQSTATSCCPSDNVLCAGCAAGQGQNKQRSCLVSDFGKQENR